MQIKVEKRVQALDQLFGILGGLIKEEEFMTAQASISPFALQTIPATPRLLSLELLRGRRVDGAPSSAPIFWGELSDERSIKEGLKSL